MAQNDTTPDNRPTDLDAVRAALAAATPGPWESRWSEADNWYEVHGQPYDGMVCPEVATLEAGGRDDAHLIAHAPEWLAALADEVEALREKLARVEALADEWDSAVPDRGPEPHWFRSRNDLEAAADDLCEALGRS